MADQPPQRPKPTRSAPPPFVGLPHPGGLSPKTRPSGPTLPPFSPPFIRPPSPAVPSMREKEHASAAAQGAEASWFEEEPNDASRAGADRGEAGVPWVNPDEPARATSPSASQPSGDGDDVFGWDPAEERAGALDVSVARVSLDTLKELEPWALPGAESAISNSEELAAVLERVAARIRSGELFVPGASTTTDEAALASVLAALLQRARG
jgi:hypothetical protein